ncbi:hypothetical protein OSB04_014828 [Centaurea solstitialis]|uniref:TFIIS N-terminal domain-containing protein n=1 Tax=Centaurea solstitialis TaxID=347529 RepID=A0AA38SY00_9ASTR|nr:hypothetical protein OSB04_014828 [Centaurea solstitialis]
MLYIEEELKKSEAEIMDEWRNNLRSITRNGDVFELIKRAIMVAAYDHPTEFLMKRDEIAQILFSSHHQENNIGCEKKMKEDEDVNNHDGIIYDGDLVHENHMVTTTTDDDEVLRIKHILDDAKLHESDEALVYESLSKLEEMGGMTFKTLEATKIGISVKGFQKHASMDIRQIARRLIKKWRCVADEWIEASEKASSCVFQQEEEKEAKVEEKQMVVKKESSSVVKLRIISEEKPNMEEGRSETIERKIEESKRKLHQRYEEAESAKRQRKIQVIQPYQLTKKQKQGLIRIKI